MIGRVRRWGPWLALVLLLAAGLALGASRGGQSRPTLEGETLAIAGKVRCPVCQGETAAASDTPSAEGIRARIRTDLQRGESTQQILNGLVADFGVSILETPPASGIALWAWVAPVVVAVAAAVGLLLGFRHWRRKSRVRLDLGVAAGGAVASGGAATAAAGSGSAGGGSAGGAGVAGGGASAGGAGVAGGGPSGDDEALVAEALAARALAEQARAGRPRAGRPRAGRPRAGRH